MSNIDNGMALCENAQRHAVFVCLFSEYVDSVARNAQ